MRRAAVGLGVVLLAVVAAWALVRRAEPALLRAAGPLQISNRTSTPLTLWGQRLPRHARVVLEPGPTLEATWQDDEHLGVVVPPLALPREQVRTRVRVRVVTDSGEPIAGEAFVDVVNDAAFRDVTALAADGQGHVAAVSGNTDELWLDGQPRAVGDGPRAITVWRDGEEAWWVVTLEEEGALRLLSTRTPTRTRTIALGGRPQAAAVDDARGVAYVSERAHDEVLEVSLRDGVVRRRVAVDPQPESLALSDSGRTLWIASLGAETLAALDLTVATATPARVRVGPGAVIAGGPTAAYAPYVMGDKPARALAVAEGLGVIFAATLGPNIGPNPDRMEVTMASGVTVVDARTRRHLWHVPLDRGVVQDLVYDAARQRVYAADVGAGRVVMLDALALADSATAAASAQLAAYALPVPAHVPRIRDEADLAPAHPSRAGVSLHAGPWALASDGDVLYVLARFSRTVERLDAATLEPRGVVRLDLEPEAQPTRRRGQIVYFTDVSGHRMTCDTCHPGGRDGGLLFTKGQPIQIHRSIGIRSAHDSAPYFTPARLPTLATMSKIVLSRNRFDDPPASPAEVTALTEYTLALSAPPSPFRPGAALPTTLTLPDGRVGRPDRGRALFEGAGGCAEARCHAPPHFTGDQAAATRGLFHDVGTPRRLALREAMQDAAPAELPPPSLLGVWDAYPLLFSGAGGFVVQGEQVVVHERFALEAAMAHHRHTLTPAELTDVLAFLMTL
jgi:hypothetical protein